jgi:hypothetical protein
MATQATPAASGPKLVDREEFYKSLGGKYDRTATDKFFNKIDKTDGGATDCIDLEKGKDILRDNQKVINDAENSVSSSNQDGYLQWGEYYQWRINDGYTPAQAVSMWRAENASGNNDGNLDAAELNAGWDDSNNRRAAQEDYNYSDPTLRADAEESYYEAHIKPNDLDGDEYLNRTEFGTMVKHRYGIDESSSAKDKAKVDAAWSAGHSNVNGNDRGLMTKVELVEREGWIRNGLQLNDTVDNEIHPERNTDSRDPNYGVNLKAQAAGKRESLDQGRALGQHKMSDHAASNQYIAPIQSHNKDKYINEMSVTEAQAYLAAQRGGASVTWQEAKAWVDARDTNRSQGVDAVELARAPATK